MTNDIGNRHQPGAVTNVNPAKLFITLTRHRHTEDAIRLDKNGSVFLHPPTKIITLTQMFSTSI